MATNGNNSYNGSSPTFTGGSNGPWLTIGKANSTLQAGDTVEIRGGDFSGTSNQIKPANNGTSTQPITYKRYQSETPVITGMGLSNPPPIPGIDLSSRSYIIVDGITVDGKQPYTASTIRMWALLSGSSCHHNTLQNCTFKYARGALGMRFANDSHHNKLLNSTLDYCGTWWIPGTEPGTHSSSGDAFIIESGSNNNLVEGNTFTHSGHNLLTVNGDKYVKVEVDGEMVWVLNAEASEYNVIRNNVFDNDWSDVEGAGKGERTVAFGGKYNVFEHNVVKNAKLDSSGDDALAMKVEGIGSVVRRNFIINNFEDAMSTVSRGKIGDSRDSKIYHNVFYNNGGPAWRLYFYNDGTLVDNNVLKNNILYKNRQSPDIPQYDAEISFSLQNQSGGLLDNQVVNNAMVKTTVGDARIFVNSGGGSLSIAAAETQYSSNFWDNIEAVPSFVSSNPAEPEDFELSSGSAMIDAGAFLTTTAGSGSGTSVTVADAGYFYGGSELVEGDLVQIGSNSPVRLTAVNYSTNVLTLESSVSWSNGDGVSLPYIGSAPDIGAWEFGSETAPGTVIFSDNFSYSNGALPSNYWSEGNAAQIQDGRLYVNANGGTYNASTIWLNQVFSGDLRIEYDAHVLASTNGVNNINNFVLYSDPSGVPLYDTQSGRLDGSYSKYHNLNGYITTYVKDSGLGRFRLRDVPGFSNLLDEAFTYNADAGVTRHVVIEKVGDQITYKVDGNTMLDVADDQFNPVHQQGLLGFRTFGTELWWDNLVITDLSGGGGGASLAAHWTLDETSGTSAADSSGNGNTGTLQNGPAWTTGEIGNGLSFDGVDDVVNAGSGASLDDLPALTVAAWIKPTDMGEGGYGRIVVKNNNGSAGWQFMTSSTEGNQLTFGADFSTTDLNRRAAQNSIATGTWQHVAVTWDGSATAANVKIYVDGSEVTYAATTNGAGSRVADSSSNVYLGNLADGTRTFDGILDDVRIYEGVLSSVEIQAIALAGPPDITTTSLPSGRTTISYGNQQLAATGGTTPYAWSVSAGSLPAGLSLSSGGVVSGTPTTAETANFTARVTDATSQFDDQALSITINTNSVPDITTTSLPGGTVGSAYNQSVASTGGDGALAWTVSGGTLPGGLALSNINSQNATISGTPTTADTFNFTLKLQDVDADEDTQALSIVVNPPPPGSFSLSTPADSATGVATTPTLDWGDATGAATYTLLVDDDSDFSSPSINETGIANSEYTVGTALASSTAYYWKVTAVNAGGSTPASNNDFSFTTAGAGGGSTVYEAESLSETHSSGDSATTFSEAGASGGSNSLLQDTEAIGDYIRYTVTGLSSGTYNVKIRAAKYTNRAKSNLYVDGNLLGSEMNQYDASGSYVYQEWDQGSVTLGSGSHTFELRVSGQGAGGGWKSGADYIKLTPVLHYEAESLAETHSSGDSATTFSEAGASGGINSLLQDTEAIGDYIRYTITGLSSGTYNVKIRAAKKSNRAKCNLYVDGNLLGSEMNQYDASASYTYQEWDQGNVTLGAGSHTFELRISGQGAGGGWKSGADYIRLTPQ